MLPWIQARRHRRLRRRHRSDRVHVLPAFGRHPRADHRGHALALVIVRSGRDQLVLQQGVRVRHSQVRCMARCMVRVVVRCVVLYNAPYVVHFVVHFRGAV